MSGGDGYAFDPEAAEKIERGLNNAISELNDLGFDIESQMGRGFDNLSLSPREAGHPGLESTFEDFCERWGWGVRNGVQAANDIARGLGLSAGIYYDQEQYVEGTLKIAANAAWGDPALSEKKVLDSSWNDAVNPFHNAGIHSLDTESMGNAWKQAGDDLSTSPYTPFMGQDTDWQWGGAPEAPKTEAHLEGPKAPTRIEERGD